MFFVYVMLLMRMCKFDRDQIDLQTIYIICFVWKEKKKREKKVGINYKEMKLISITFV